VLPTRDESAAVDYVALRDFVQGHIGWHALTRVMCVDTLVITEWHS